MLYFLLLYKIGALTQGQIRLENTQSFSFASQSNIYPFQSISKVSHDVGNKILCFLLIQNSIIILTSPIL